MLATVVVSFLILALIVTVYACQLAIGARGNPDQAIISRFAAKLSHWFMPASRTLLTGLAAGLIARKADSQAILHGLLIGIGVSMLNLVMSLVFSGRVSLRLLVFVY